MQRKDSRISIRQKQKATHIYPFVREAEELLRELSSRDGHSRFWFFDRDFGGVYHSGVTDPLDLIESQRNGMESEG